MTEESPLIVSRRTALTILLLVLLFGVGGTWIVMRDRFARPTRGGSPSGPPAAATPAPGLEPSSDSAPLPNIVIPLTKDAMERVGLVVTTVSTQTMADQLRLPGTVEPNAYRAVSVTPLVGGRIVRVSVQLGDRVRRGQSIAQVYSPELADARTKYVAARAMLAAHDRELQRTQKLVEIGAASRQELERIHAEHEAQLAEVESARSRLQLLGATASDTTASDRQDASATTDVPAPIDGIVVERMANVGLNVDPATKLFTVVDLSSIWVIASAYERDLHRIREGARATVTAKAYPELSLEGRVSYIDPQLNEDTRTANVRVEVANPRGELRLGMYADVVIAGSGGAPVVTIPKRAIQNVGNHQVVYVPAPNDPTAFTEREVRVGRAVGDALEVVSGLKAGDSVVSEGSFFVRAEAERLGLRTSGRAAPSPQPSSGGGAGAATREVQTAKIVLSEKGYEPAKVRLRAGAPARITFVRTTNETCGTEVAFPSLNIKRPLPLNEPVTIEFTPTKAGDIAFACGTNMLKGVVVIE
jgi:cobalt-zinc-cadmium efflux system membrane fusion protein